VAGGQLHPTLDAWIMEYLAVYASDQEGQEEEQGEDGGGDGGGSVDEPPALPRAVREMFGEDTVENSGREHDRRSGMWPAHIYIPVDGCDGLQHLAKRARLRFSRAVEAVASAPRHPHKRSRRECDSSYSPIPIDSIDDLHVSLSHNLKLRGHELDPLATSLRQALCGAGGKKGFRIEISSSFDVMVNGERDRSFCSLKVVGGKERILNIIGAWLSTLAFSVLSKKTYASTLCTFCLCRHRKQSSQALSAAQFL
jgi:hypothetical protein